MIRLLAAKLFQLAGLLTLPFGVYYAEKLGSMGIEIKALCAGALLFVTGRLLEKSAGAEE